MTKSEIKKLQVKEADLWNDLKAWEGLCTDKELETCNVYKIKLRHWSSTLEVLKMLNVKTDFKLHKTQELLNWYK